MELNNLAKEQIQWWYSNIEIKNGRKIRPDRVSLSIQSDASKSGYGSYQVEEKKSSGGR